MPSFILSDSTTYNYKNDVASCHSKKEEEKATMMKRRKKMKSLDFGEKKLLECFFFLEGDQKDTF